MIAQVEHIEIGKRVRHLNNTVRSLESLEITFH
jgi:hypothetical protein